MAKLTEEMVHARTRQSNLAAVSKLNCWGSELQDVSLVRRLPNVETLSLSVNKIRSLADFQHCKKLQHLFVRKNDIRELNQVCYLRDLPELSTLWLAENPCASGPGYRLAVIKALPRLEKLDDVPVTVEERTEAQRHGAYLSHPDSDEPHENEEDHEISAYQDEQGKTDSQVGETRDRSRRAKARGQGDGGLPTPGPTHVRRAAEDTSVVRHPPSREEDTDEQFVTRSNHYPQTDNSRHYQRNDYSPELSSPVHSSYLRSAANSYSQEETVQSNGYEPGYDHVEDDYRPHSSAIHIATPNHHRTNKDLVEDDSPPQSIKQEEDPEDLHSRGLTRSRTEGLRNEAGLKHTGIKTMSMLRTAYFSPQVSQPQESLPRLSRLEVDDSEEYSRAVHPRCRLDLVARGAGQDMGDPEPRTVLTRSRTVDMLGGHHAGSLSSLHERERPRLKPCEVFIPRSLQPPQTRPRNINVLNAVLCLIKELELQDLELVAMSVNCRIDELRV